MKIIAIIFTAIMCVIFIAVIFACCKVASDYDDSFEKGSDKDA